MNLLNKALNLIEAASYGLLAGTPLAILAGGIALACNPLTIGFFLAAGVLCFAPYTFTTVEILPVEGY